MDIVLIIVGEIMVGYYAYKIGWVNGNEEGFSECSEIWQSQYKANGVEK